MGVACRCLMYQRCPGQPLFIICVNVALRLYVLYQECVKALSREEVEDVEMRWCPLLQMTDVKVHVGITSLKWTWGWLPLWKVKSSQSSSQSIQSVYSMGATSGGKNTSFMYSKGSFSQKLTMMSLTLNHSYVCKKSRLFVLALAPDTVLSPLNSTTKADYTDK